MRVAVSRVGHEQTPVAVIDDVIADPQACVDTAAALAPFPEISGNYYPGRRRQIRRDEPANAYTATICNTVAPVMQEVFGVGRFHVKEASFSIVTQRPETTQLIQRVPHFDTLDPTDFAVLHYLSKPVDIDQILGAFEGKSAPTNDDPGSVPSLARVEWEHIQRVLTDCEGNISRAARLLGLHRRSLQRKLGKDPVRR